MTWIELVQKFFPDATEKQADFILWEKTAFPFASVETIEKQLQEFQINCFAERRSNSMIQ